MAKRLFDLLSSLIALGALMPVFIVICLFIRRDGGPAFFRQERVGKNGQLFKLYKFRSMVINAEKLGSQVTASHDPRITGIGRLLRRTKLDELPQLLNVFLGNMSIVGAATGGFVLCEQMELGRSAYCSLSQAGNNGLCDPFLP